MREQSIPSPALARLRRAGLLLALALAAGLLMSTQFLVQPFVWRYYELGEVLAGWLAVARDQTVAAVTLMAAVTLAQRLLPARVERWRHGAVAAAIVAGAVLGQLVLRLIDADAPPASLRQAAPQALRWTVVGLTVAGMVHFWHRAVRERDGLEQAELSRLQAQRQLAELGLQRLRAQIEPHFLFNTLATVRLLGDRDVHGASQLLQDFAAYLRQVVAVPGTQEVTLGRELALAEAYLRLIAVRMGPRLQVDVDVPQALRGCRFPTLALATLVENAVKHGIAPRPQGGTIRIGARAVEGALEVEVLDTGVGLQVDAGHGIGLANTRERLAFLYGEGATLQLRQQAPHGVRATLRLPLRRSEAG